MSRVIRYWMVLGVLTAVTMYGGGYFALNQIDLTFLQFATVVCASLLQATVLVWREERPAAVAASVARAAFRHPLAQPVLVLDALLLGAGIAWWHAHVIGFGAALNVHMTWTLVKGLAATAFFIRAVLRASSGERTGVALHVMAPVLLIFAIEPSASWLAAGFARAHAALGWHSEVLLRLAFYVPLFLLLVAMTLRSARVLTPRSREAGALLQATIAAALVGAVTVMLASFNLPTIVQPWLGVATFSASVATTCALLAAIFLATARSGPR